MLEYIKKIIDRTDNAQLHNYCAIGSFYFIAGITTMLAIGLLFDKKVGVEFISSLGTLATFSGYLVKKGNDSIEQFKPDLPVNKEETNSQG